MLRLAALMGAGTFAVHQARYALGYRGEASGALAAQGHAYLIAVGPLLAGALMLVLAELVRRLARGAAAPAPRFRRLWAGVSLALVAVYSLQEIVEGAVARHHPSGIAALASHGGWVAVPLAVAFGLAIAAAMRGASAATGLGRQPRPWRAPPPLTPETVRVPQPRAGFPRAGARFAHGPRGPPLLAA